MRVAIYAPVALWERHHAAAIDIAWIEHNRGNQVVFLNCSSALSSCAANMKNELRKCKDCMFQSKYSSINFLPEDTEVVWFRNETSEPYPEELVQNVRNQGEMIDFTFDGWEFGRSVLSQLVSMRKEFEVEDELIQTLGQKILKNSIQTYRKLLSLFAKDIKKIYIWGGRRSSEACAIFAAQKLGIEIVFFELGATDEKYVITKNELHTFNGIFNEVQEWRLAKWNEGNENIRTSSGKKYLVNLKLGRSVTPHYRNFQEDSNSPLPNRLLDTKKPIMGIFTSSLWEFAAFRDYEDCHNDFKQPYKLYKRLSTDEELAKSFTLFFRWHPNLRNAGDKELSAIKEVISSHGSAIHILPDDGINSYDLIDKCDIVVTVGSTIGLESTFWGKPSVLLGKSQYSGLGVAYEPRNFSEFKELVMGNLSPLPPSGAILWADWMSNFGDNYQYVKNYAAQYYFNNLRIRKLSKSAKLRERYYLFKHIVKQKINTYTRDQVLH